MNRLLMIQHEIGAMHARMKTQGLMMILTQNHCSLQILFVCVAAYASTCVSVTQLSANLPLPRPYPPIMSTLETPSTFLNR